MPKPIWARSRGLTIGWFTKATALEYAVDLVSFAVVGPLFAQLSWLNILILLLPDQKSLAQIRLQRNNAGHINDQDGT
jgi:hypothetical protein